MGAIFCCGILVAIPIGFLIGSLILRAAVWISNKILGPRQESFDEDEYEDEEEYTGSRRRSIPQPTIGQGMMVVLLYAIINFGAQMMVKAAMIGAAAPALVRGGVEILAALIGMPISFLVMAWMCTALLPTSFGRACLVVLFYFLICTTLATVIVVGLIMLGVAGGFGR